MLMASDQEARPPPGLTYLLNPQDDEVRFRGIAKEARIGEARGGLTKVPCD